MLLSLHVFGLISGCVLYAFTLLCYWLPKRKGRKITAITVSTLLIIIITYTFIKDVDFLVIIIWPVIIAFQIIFIVYWIFINIHQKKLAQISSAVLSIIVLLVILEPWITDWTFSKKDAKDILLLHDFELRDDFKLLSNETSGLMDYTHSFTLQISATDHKRLAAHIRTSKNFAGLITHYEDIPASALYDLDTANYETIDYVRREYYTKEKMKDGTYHFIITLSKANNEIHFFAINE